MEILKEIFPQNVLNDGIECQNDPMYKLLPSVSNYNSNDDHQIRRRKKNYQPTSPTEDVTC